MQNQSSVEELVHNGDRDPDRLGGAPGPGSLQLCGLDYRLGGSEYRGAGGEIQRCPVKTMYLLPSRESVSTTL